MPQIVTAIDIDAAPALVWEVLSDTARYGEWNPLVSDVKGPLRSGGKIKARLHFEGKSFPFDAEVLRVEPGKALTWIGPSFKPARFLFSGEHFFEIKEVGEGRCRFFHGEKLRGVFFDIESVWVKAEPRIEPVYARFNEALKARAELS
jgi:hypothetical protein